MISNNEEWFRPPNTKESAIQKLTRTEGFNISRLTCHSVVTNFEREEQKKASIFICNHHSNISMHKHRRCVAESDR